MTDSIKPKKFVGLHAHTHFSVGDGLGTPEEHIQFALENGMDAIATTDHGNMNAFSHQKIAEKRLKDKGIDFFSIPGNEFYFIPSLEEWENIREERLSGRQAKKSSKAKTSAATNKKNNSVLDELPKEVRDSHYKSAKEDIEDSVGTAVIENEDESKKEARYKDPLTRRNHLVLLPKNKEGVKALFALTSESYVNGFYRYPRIDLDLLRKYANGNIIALSACVGGPLAYTILTNQEEGIPWDDLGPNDYNFETIQRSLKDQIEEFQDALGKENFYLELQWNKLKPQHLINQHLIAASKTTGAKLVSTCDSHYARPDLWREREIYRMMAWMNKTKDEINKDALPKAIDELKCELYPKNAEQMWAAYKDTTKEYDFYDDVLVKDSIEQSWSIAHEQIDKKNMQIDTSVRLPGLHKIVGLDTLAKVESDLKKSKGHDADVDEDIDFDEEELSFHALRLKAINGLKWRLDTISKAGHIKLTDETISKYTSRLREELDVIKALNFSKYFLTYSKIMDVTTNRMITGPARGSAGGSLLAYVLNITQVDPIKYGLLFERFLTRHKKGFPDIDSDFSDRELAVQYIAEHFGETNTIPVSNFVQLQMKSLIKDTLKLEGVPFDEVNVYTAKVYGEAQAEARKKPGFDGAMWYLTFDEAMENSETFRELMEKYPTTKRTLQVLFKAMRGMSRHAGGIVVTDDGMRDMPLVKSGGVIQTPWPEGLNFRHLETFGFLKFDILGLGTLRMFEDAIGLILEKKLDRKPSFEEIKQWYYDNLHPDNNPMDDQLVYKTVYHDGKFAGIFQFVNSTAQNLVKQLKPENITDIAVSTSIIRPGPLSAGADKLYLKQRKNPHLIKWKHPLLKEVLGDTAGLIVFQEQLQMIYHKLAGVPLDETDDVRKAFTKKDMSTKDEAEKERERLRNDFIEKCFEANKIEPNVSGEIFDELEKYVSYSFNKSHAISYAIISYMCAWLYTYYPNEWIAAYIDYTTTEKGKVTGKEDPKSVALAEAKRLGFEIADPDINLCREKTYVVNKNILPSFASMKYCGRAATEEILANRPYNSLEELLVTYDAKGNMKWRHSKFNKRGFSTLIKLRAFGSMDLIGKEKRYIFKSYRHMHYTIVDNMDQIRKFVTRKNKGDQSLLEFIENIALSAPKEEIKEYSLEEQVEFLDKLAGISANTSLLVPKNMRQYLFDRNIPSMDDIQEGPLKQTVWAIVANSNKAITRTGKHYLRARIFSDSMAEHQCFLWGFNPEKDATIPKNSVIIAKLEKNDFGFNGFYSNVEIIKVAEEE